MIPIKHFTSSVLAGLLRRQPLSPEKVTFAWQTAAGAALARATSARLGPDGVLEIGATSPHWAREIDRSRALLLDRVRVLLGEETVRRIAVRTEDR
jgi:predicted nucleic acid-binding Zn ribbon protein